MDVTLLGSGDATGVPPIFLDLDDCEATARRRRPGLLVETASTTVLLDASPDLPEQLRAVGIDHLDAAFVTHWHHDHAGGVEELGLVSSALDVELGLTATAADHLRTERAHLAGSFEETRLEHGRRVQVGELSIVPFPVAHARPEFDTVGFRLTHDGSTVVYAPDVERFCPERPAGETYRDADLLFVEGTGIFRPDVFDLETDPETMITGAGADRTVLIHLNEAFLGRSTAALERRAAEVGVEVGTDFETYSL